jgi:hypothetical protein
MRIDLEFVNGWSSGRRISAVMPGMNQKTPITTVKAYTQLLQRMFDQGNMKQVKDE